MNQPTSEKDITVWRRLVDSHKAFALALRDFLSGDIDRVALMRNALRGEGRLTAIYVLSHLTVSELQQLFSELVFLASFSHGPIQAVRNAILSLPREWVIVHIEETAEPFLLSGTYDEYRRLLELFIDLDRDLALRLAHRAAAHPDHDIKEAGEDFLSRLGLAD